MSDATVRRRVLISGRVHGVFFRDATRALAEEHGVAGWVRNRPDGRVEAIFEGPETAVIELLGFSRTGPPRARVESVQTLEEPPEGLTGFEIR